MSNTLKLVLSIAIPLAVGATAGFFTASGVDSWYATILKPSWNPPNWIFGPVWTSLYILMGISLYLVWKSGTPEKTLRMTILIFAVQLLLNFAWSFIFFKQQQPGWAFAEIILLWIMIFVTILLFARISKPAAWLLVPYISWVSFAAILNYTIWKLNEA